MLPTPFTSHSYGGGGCPGLWPDATRRTREGLPGQSFREVGVGGEAQRSLRRRLLRQGEREAGREEYRRGGKDCNFEAAGRRVVVGLSREGGSAHWVPRSS